MPFFSACAIKCIRKSRGRPWVCATGAASVTFCFQVLVAALGTGVLDSFILPQREAPFLPDDYAIPGRSPVFRGNIVLKMPPCTQNKRFIHSFIHSANTC